MVVKTLCLVSFLCVMAFSQIAPFYPLMAKDKGVEIFYIGFVIG